jgi:Zn-dependent protease with chaperone function
MIEAPTAVHRARLNPFIFPADSQLRFLLLIVAVLGASVFSYFYLYTAIAGAQHTRNLMLCQDAAAALYPRDLAAQIASREACAEPFEQAQAAWIIGGTLLLFAAGAIIYWRMPARKIRLSRLTPLTDEDAPDVIVYVAEACREIGLARAPIFMWNPLDPVKRGVAFGRLGRSYVALSGGLVTQFYTDQPAFRAVLLHELAHLRNADTNISYFAVAIWQAFVLAALAPFAIGLVITLMRSLDDLSLVLNLAWRGLLLAALVYLTRSAILRTRELYADVRASSWDGAGSALERVLAQLSGARVGRWPALLAMHPDPATRRQAIEQTHRLLHMAGWEAFGTGFATMLACANLFTLFALLLPSRQEGLAAVAALLLCAPLAAGYVVIGGWRGVFVSWARGEQAPGAARLGLGLGLGMLAGQLAAYYTAVQSIAFNSQAEQSETAVFYLLWSIVLLTTLVCLQRWIGETAAVWLDVIRTPGGLRRALIVAILVTAGLLSAWLGLLLRAQIVGEASVQLLLSAPLTALDSPLVLLGLTGLWALPLSSRSGALVAPTIAPWMLLDATPCAPARARRVPLRPGLALRNGLAAGLVFSVLIVLARIGLRLAVPEEVRGTEQFFTLFVYGQIGLAALIQAGTAAVMAARISHAGITHGLFAAFIGGSTIVAGILATSLLFGGTINLPVVGSIFAQIVNAGALLSLPTATCAAAMAGWYRWRHQRDKRSARLAQG